MQTRDKVRILLLNPMGEILLMRIEDPHSQELNNTRDITSRWITIGGTVEPGESVEEAARREAHEETGFSDIEIGAQLDYREIAFAVHGKPVLFKETYIAATTGSLSHDSEGWTEEERSIVKELRWWPLDALRATDEIFFPADLVAMMEGALSNYLSS